ncbi:MAG: sodium:calcium antiporter, partial [Bacteroidetes bacterium]
MEDVLYLIGGLAVLVFAGDLLVKGAVSLAVKLKVSLLVIGVVVVSFGTSAPELLVSLKAALEGHPDISIGNVVGSNIANISLVLGLTAVVFPIYVVYDTLRYDWPVMFLATLLLILFSMDFVLQRWEGIILFLILIGYSVFLIRKSRKEKKNKEVVEEERNVSFFKALLYVLAGGVGLSYGADWLVQGASGIALKLG